MTNFPQFDGLSEGESVRTAEEGTVVLGKLLGSGGFGRVFQAMADGRLMATKSVRQTKESIVKKTLIEISVLKSWSFSGFTPDFYGSAEFGSGSVVLIFMELMGPSLHDVVERNKKTGQFFSTPDILKIGNQICQALSYLNSVGYVHRDVKPKNVCLYLDDPFKVKLVDLGEVCRIDELNDEIKTFGTHCYSAPEVLNGLHLDEKLDIWSVGCLLAELRLGLRLFPGGKDVEVYKLHNYWGLHLPFGTTIGPVTKLLESKHCSMTIDENRHPTMLGHICKNRDISKLNSEEQHLVKYIMCMLEFSPEDRPSAAELCK